MGVVMSGSSLIRMRYRVPVRCFDLVGWLHVPVARCGCPPTTIQCTGGRPNRDTTFKVIMQRGHILYDLQVNCVFGNMYPNVVSIDNGLHFVLFRDLTVKYDR